MYMILKGCYRPCQVRVQILSQLRISFLENRVKKVVEKTLLKRDQKKVLNYQYVH